MIKLWVDFNASSDNGVRLNCRGTIDDLLRQKIVLEDGMRLLLWDDDTDENDKPDNLIVEATARFNKRDGIWEGVFNHDNVRHESDLTA